MNQKDKVVSETDEADELGDAVSTKKHKAKHIVVIAKQSQPKRVSGKITKTNIAKKANKARKARRAKNVGKIKTTNRASQVGNKISKSKTSRANKA